MSYRVDFFNLARKYHVDGKERLKLLEMIGERYGTGKTHFFEDLLFEIRMQSTDISRMRLFADSLSQIGKEHCSQLADKLYEQANRLDFSYHDE